jgi:hydroxymethylpyrimidine/phosphomethylpyrimidine kinase
MFISDPSWLKTIKTKYHPSIQVITPENLQKRELETMAKDKKTESQERQEAAQIIVAELQKELLAEGKTPEEVERILQNFS